MFHKPAKKQPLTQKIDKLFLPLSLKDINENSQQTLSGGGAKRQIGVPHLVVQFSFPKHL